MANMKLTNSDILEFIESVQNETRQKDALIVMGMMNKITELAPFKRGHSIVGFENYVAQYPSTLCPVQYSKSSW